MASGDIYVRKEAKAKMSSPEVIIFPELFMIHLNFQAPEGDLAMLKEDTSSETERKVTLFILHSSITCD